jgi:hypothetical protein
MDAADVVLLAAVVACVAAVVVCSAAVVLVGQVRRLERAIEAVRAETVPMVHEARQVVDRASTEMARVEAVLEDTGSVTATVDSASRLAQRAFASPVVKILALRAGTAGGMRRLRRPAGPPARETGAARTKAAARRNGADRGRNGSRP